MITTCRWLSMSLCDWNLALIQRAQRSQRQLSLSEVEPCPGISSKQAAASSESWDGLQASLSGSFTQDDSMFGPRSDSIRGP